MGYPNGTNSRLKSIFNSHLIFSMHFWSDGFLITCSRTRAKFSTTSNFTSLQLLWSSILCWNDAKWQNCNCILVAYKISYNCTQKENPANISVMCAAQLGKLQEFNKIWTVPTFYWTDSKILLTWTNSRSSSFHTFVLNRIASIQHNTLAEQWRHLRSN